MKYKATLDITDDDGEIGGAYYKCEEPAIAVHFALADSMTVEEYTNAVIGLMALAVDCDWFDVSDESRTIMRNLSLRFEQTDAVRKIQKGRRE